MATEDLTTYDETDPGSEITVTSSRVTWANVGSATAAHVVDDKGAGHFDGDWDHRFKCYLNSSSDYWTYSYVYACTDQLGSYAEQLADDVSGVFYRHRRTSSSATNSFMFTKESGVTGGTDSYTSYQDNTVYYTTITRDDDGGANSTGRYTAYICTVNHYGETGAVLQDTLTVDASSGQQNDFRYVYAYCAPDDDQDYYEAYGYTEDLDLQEASGSPQALAGTIAATSSAAGALSVAKDLAGTAGASTSVSGALSVARSLAGSIDAVTTVAGTLARARALAGTIAAGSAVAGSLQAAKPLAGSSGASASVSGALSVARSLAGSVGSQADVTGALTTVGEVSLAGTIAATSGASGALQAAKPLAGSSGASTTVSGALSVAMSLTGSVDSQTDVTGALTTAGEITLTGTIAATGGASGALQAAKPLAGSSGASTTVSGALSVARTLGGSIGAVTTVTGTPGVVRGLAGTITATARPTGAVTVAWSLAGTIAAEADLSGALLTGAETDVPLAGTIAALTSCVAALQIMRGAAGCGAALATMAAADADTVLDGLLAESATYTPAGGSGRAIEVVVDRQAPSLEDNPRRQVRPVRVWAKNDTSAGVSSAELTRRDTITLARHIGGIPTALRIVRRVSQSDGWTELELL